MSVRADALKLGNKLNTKIQSGGSAQEVAAILNEGIDIDILNGNYTTALYYASLYERTDIIELLILRGAKIDHGRSSPLFPAVSNNNTEHVSLLLQHKAQVNARRSTTGRTPLHIAALEDRFEAARLLLENKADYTLTDNYFMTPIMMESVTDRSRQLISEQIDKDNATPELNLLKYAK